MRGHLTPAVASGPRPVHVARPAAARVSDSPLTRCAGFICYTPAEIRRAYGVDKLTRLDGAGRTIVIVDAYDAPKMQTDLDNFDTTFGLPALTVPKFAPQGLTPFNDTDPEQLGWSGEIALDVEWAHAIAPRAKIKLVLARSSNDADIVAALAWAVDRNLGDVISMSFGEGESCGDPKLVRQLHGVFTRATDQDITLIASSGDQGAAQFDCNDSGFFKSASWPATDPLVTGIGGTQLLTDALGNYVSEVAWNEGTDFVVGSGGGLSGSFAPPAYQRALGYPRRATPDVAYSAAGDGSVLVFWSDDPTLPQGLDALYGFSGTSAGAPQWSALVTLANQLGRARVGQINAALYRSPSRLPAGARLFHDITVGNNTFHYVDASGALVTIPGFDATEGYDLVTGLGTPLAERVVPYLAANALAR